MAGCTPREGIGEQDNIPLPFLTPFPRTYALHNSYAEGQGGLLSRPRSLASKNALRTSFARDSRVVSGFVSVLRSLGYTIMIRVGRLRNDGSSGKHILSNRQQKTEN